MYLFCHELGIFREQSLAVRVKLTHLLRIQHLIEDVGLGTSLRDIAQSRTGFVAVKLMTSGALGDKHRSSFNCLTAIRPWDECRLGEWTNAIRILPGRELSLSPTCLPFGLCFSFLTTAICNERERQGNGYKRNSILQHGAVPFLELSDF